MKSATAAKGAAPTTSTRLGCAAHYATQGTCRGLNVTRTSGHSDDSTFEAPLGTMEQSDAGMQPVPSVPADGACSLPCIAAHSQLCGRWHFRGGSGRSSISIRHNENVRHPRGGLGACSGAAPDVHAVPHEQSAPVSQCGNCQAPAAEWPVPRLVVRDGRLVSERRDVLGDV